MNLTPSLAWARQLPWQPSRWALVAASAALLATAVQPSVAHPNSHGGSSDLSLMSALPVAVSVVAPVAIVMAGSLLTVVAVQASAQGTVWVLERASDGARASVHLAGHASVAVGTAVACTAMASGTLLAAGGRALAFVPNELGRSLLHQERLTW